MKRIGSLVECSAARPGYRATPADAELGNGLSDRVGSLHEAESERWANVHDCELTTPADRCVAIAKDGSVENRGFDLDQNTCTTSSGVMPTMRG